MTQLNGIVKWFNNAKGFGFISRDEGPDVSCHYSPIEVDGYKSLKEGELVTFNIIRGVKGVQTDKVVRQEHNTGYSTSSSVPTRGNA